MKKIALLALLAHPVLAADFAKWWPEFQAVVAKADAKAVARQAHFPMEWENDKIREIKTEADLLRSLDLYFTTAQICKTIATKKPELLPDGSYLII